MTFPLELSDPRSLGFAPAQLAKLDALIDGHIADGRYPGAQVALARHGKLAYFRSYGNARLEPEQRPVGDDTLFLLFSNTKVLVSSAVWRLIEDGAVSLGDRIADFMPEFSVNDKADISLYDVMTHQGGFPGSNVSRASWNDHARMRADVCGFELEWPPGSRLQYHPRAAHYVLAMVIEAVTGRDYRKVVRTSIVEPLGLQDELFLGVPADQQSRCVDVRGEPVEEKNTPEFRTAGLPFGGSFGTARAQVTFYQMLLQEGRLNEQRILSPRMVAYLRRDLTGDRMDANQGVAMHRGLGPHLRGSPTHRSGLGYLAPPSTFGHGGIGSCYCWGDPDSGVSFAYLSNEVADPTWSSSRFDRVSNIVHASID